MHILSQFSLTLLSTAAKRRRGTNELGDWALFLSGGSGTSWYIHILGWVLSTLKTNINGDSLPLILTCLTLSSLSWGQIWKVTCSISCVSCFVLFCFSFIFSVVFFQNTFWRFLLHKTQLWVKTKPNQTKTKQKNKKQPHHSWMHSNNFYHHHLYSQAATLLPIQCC